MATVTGVGTVNINIGRFAQATQQQLLHSAKEWSDYLTSEMRANASWQDITGDARRELSAASGHQGSVIIVVARGGTDRAWYTVRLETEFGRRYSIIWPTMLRGIPRLFAILAKNIKI
jgi:hypothetical protein